MRVEKSPITGGTGRKKFGTKSGQGHLTFRKESEGGQIKSFRVRKGRAGYVGTLNACKEWGLLETVGALYTSINAEKRSRRGRGDKQKEGKSEKPQSGDRGLSARGQEGSG